MRSVRLAALAAFVPTLLVAADEPAAKKKAPPVPLTLTITGDATYPLDFGGLTEKAFTDQIKAAVEKNEPAPPAPAVKLAVELTNTSDQPFKVWATGDPVVLDLKLTGPAAHNVELNVPMTLEFRVPEAVEIAPGKSHSFPVVTLSGGLRGKTKRSYWTAPGDYKLTATLRTRVSPPPPGTVAEDGFGAVTLTSKPFPITVTEK